MIREDDFAKRRVEKGIADLTDEQLYDKFWEMCSKVVDPLLELGTESRWCRCIHEPQLHGVSMKFIKGRTDIKTP